VNLALDHARDFDAILAAEEPFALVRFGDGEAAIIAGQAHKAANNEWAVAKGDTWLRIPLMKSLLRAGAGYCVGLPPGCCLPKHTALHHRARVPLGQRTFATIFLHGNLARVPELLDRYQPLVVGPRGEIKIPEHAVEIGCDVDAIVADLLTVERPMVVAAGPLANVIIDRYWKRQAPEKRQTILDIGSALDFHQGRASRYYHRGWLLRHHCTLLPPTTRSTSASITKSQARKTTMTTTNRVTIGRSGQTTTSRARSKPNRGPAVKVRSGTRRGRTVAVGTPQSRISTAAEAADASDVAENPGSGGGGGTVGNPGSKRSRCATCVRIIRARKR
jgi:hypothetical protein